MASVTLRRFFVHEASDPATYLAAYSSERSDNRELPGEVRRYTNGRLRTVVRTGAGQALSATLVNLSADEVDQLEGWMGQTLYVRDTHGRELFCSFFSLDVTDWHDGSHDVAVSFQQVTYSIAV